MRTHQPTPTPHMKGDNRRQRETRPLQSPRRRPHQPTPTPHIKGDNRRQWETTGDKTTSEPKKPTTPTNTKAARSKVALRTPTVNCLGNYMKWQSQLFVQWYCIILSMPTYGYLMIWSRSRLSRLYINTIQRVSTCKVHVCECIWIYLEYTIVHCNTFGARHRAPTLATAVPPLVERHDVVERDPPLRSCGSWTIQPPGVWIHCQWLGCNYVRA